MTRTRQQKEADREWADAQLKKLVGKGETLYTVLTNVSSSGLSRRFKVLIVKKGEIADISRIVCDALDYRNYNDNVVVGGAGMDMSFHLVYQIAGHLGYSDNRGNPPYTTNCYGLNHKHL